MDEQRPLWRTAWYWKQTTVYFLLPWTIVLSILLALFKTNHISHHAYQVINRSLTPVCGVAAVVYTMWINHRASQRTAAEHP